MKIAVSACLLGHPCKYNGGSNFCPEIADLAEEHEIIPICPEVMGGLPVPRIPCERVGDRILNQQGEDVTMQFQTGAQKALERVLQFQADLVILQPRSPSCGAGKIYDGTFSGRLIEGNGIFADLLDLHQIPHITAAKEELIRAGLHS